MCSSFSALPVSSQRKVVVHYSLLSHPLLDSPDTHCFVILMFTFNFSHLSTVFSLPHSLIWWVPCASTCQGTIQCSVPKKKCVSSTIFWFSSFSCLSSFPLPPTSPSHITLWPPLPAHSLSSSLTPSAPRAAAAAVCTRQSPTAPPPSEGCQLADAFSA